MSTPLPSAPTMNTGLRPMRSASVAQQRDRGQRHDVGDDRDPQHRRAVQPDGVDGERQRQDAEDRADGRRQRGDDDAQRRRRGGRGTAPASGTGAASSRSTRRRRPASRRGVRRMSRPTTTTIARQPERHAPAPGQQLLVGQRGDRQEHRGREDRARPGCRSSVKLVKNARRCVGRVLEAQRVRARPARRRPRCPAAGAARPAAPAPRGRSGRTSAGSRRGTSTTPISEDGQHQHPLAAEPVADVADEERADRARDVADAEGGQRRAACPSQGPTPGRRSSRRPARRPCRR